MKYGNPGVVESPEALDFGKENPEAYKQANTTAKAFGVKIKMGHYGDTFNGKIQNGVVFLNLDRINQKAQKSGKTVKRVMAEVIAHEITHRMQQTDAKAYVEYRDVALQAVASAKDLEAMIDSYKATVHEAIEKQKAEGNTPEMHELTDEEAMDEIVADLTADFIENTDKFSQFVSQSEEHRSLGKKLLDFLKKVIADIKARFKTQSARDLAATNEFGFKLTDLEEAAKKWEAAWKASEKAVKNAPVRESVKGDKTVWDIGYNSIGVSWLVRDGVIDKSQMAKFYEAVANISKRGYYCPTNSDGLYIVDLGNVLAFTDADFENPTIYKAVHFDDTYEYTMEPCKELIRNEEELSSGHGEAVKTIERMYYSGYVTDYDIPAYGANGRQNRPGKGTNSSRASGKGQTGRNPAEVKFSATGTEDLLHKATDKELDSRYAEAVKNYDSATARAAVAEKARRWGAILDKDGKPKHFYHGTSQGGFTEFDAYGHGKFGLFGIGNYFTENYDVAASYMSKGSGTRPEIYSVYLKADNPIDMDANADIAKWQAAAEEVDFSDCKTNEDFQTCSDCPKSTILRWVRLF